MADSWPIWMTSEQADRLRKELGAAGFQAAFFESFDCGHELGVAVELGERRHAVRVQRPEGLTSVVFLMKQWRDRTNG
jgi:hypothetical protein